MADRAWIRPDWLLGDPAAQGPELRASLYLQRGGPRQPGRPELGAQARRGLPGQLRVAGRAAGEFGGPRLDLLRRHGLPGQAELHGAAARYLLAEDAGRRGGLRARAPGQQPEVPAARMQPDPQEAADQPGVLGHDAQVGREHQVDPGPDRGAADRGYGWHLQLADSGEGPVDAAEGRVPAFLHRVPADLVQVTALGPGAERAAGAPDDRGPDGGIAVGLVAGRDELRGQLVVQRVPGRGRVQGDERDALGDVQINHRPLPRVGGGEPRLPRV